MERPWGGFFVISESDAKKFIEKYFPDLNKDELLKGRLSPKILLVAPHKKLSWQYHFRRSELWKLIAGTAAVITSDTDVEANTTSLKMGDTITLAKGERHRLVGLDDWGIVAEIWLHTDPNHLSDEDDIVRLQDDFGR
jgi:mannose-6-phosphate isomerase-like protein (cupin superfamily)